MRKKNQMEEISKEIDYAREYIEREKARKLRKAGGIAWAGFDIGMGLFVLAALIWVVVELCK